MKKNENEFPFCVGQWVTIGGKIAQITKIIVCGTAEREDMYIFGRRPYGGIVWGMGEDVKPWEMPRK